MNATLHDSLEHLYPDSAMPAPPRRTMRLDVPRGGTIAAHVLLRDCAPGVPLNASVRLNDDEAGAAARWFRLVDVPVRVNTGPEGFAEGAGENKNEYNADVPRRAPFRVYDAIAPLEADWRPEGETVALRLEIPVSRRARPGRRDYQLAIEAGRTRLTLRLDARVYPAAIPPVGRASFPYTNWFSLSAMAQRHGLKPWSPGHWKMIDRYARLMAKGRQNQFWIPLSDVFERVSGTLALSRRRLERLVEVFTRAGLWWIEGGPLAHRPGGWKSETYDLAICPPGPGAVSPEGDRELGRAARQLMEAIDRNGWRERWLQHVADEPKAWNAADYRMLAGMVRKYMPGIPILEATQDPVVPGAVDIWCPLNQTYQQQRDAFEAFREVGDRIWFYTCCLPGGPWLNRLLDMELVRPALLGWAAARFGLDGYLHWGLNHYADDQDPFADSVRWPFPPGDSHIVYPGAGGPWSSLRLEAQREGFEDLELLRALARRDPRTARRIIDSVCRGFDDFTKSPEALRLARRRLLVAAGAKRTPGTEARPTTFG